MEMLNKILRKFGYIVVRDYKLALSDNIDKVEVSIKHDTKRAYFSDRFSFNLN